MKSLWKNLGTGGRIALLVGLALAVVALVLTARRDLNTRDPATIRGNPEVWQRVTRFPGGAAAYLVAGRRAHHEVIEVGA